MLASVTASIAGGSRGLARGDPLAAEAFGSAVLSLWHADGLDDREAREMLARGVLDRLDRAHDADILALLIAIAAIAESPIGEWATEAADRLRGTGVPEPIWARSIERPELVEAWISTDELEDQSMVVGVFVYAGRPPHAVASMVDYNFRGLIREGWVGSEPEKLRARWVATGMPVLHLSAQRLADILANGIDWFDHYLDPPVSQDARNTMALVRARLRLVRDRPPRARRARATRCRDSRHPHAAGLRYRRPRGGLLSAHVETRHAIRLLQANAAGVGYLLKDRVLREADLVDAIRRVASGGSVIDPEVVGQLLGRARPHGPLDELTPREREVLALMAEGRSNQAIAEQLVLEPKTIEGHIRTIF